MHESSRVNCRLCVHQMNQVSLSTWRKTWTNLAPMKWHNENIDNFIFPGSIVDVVAGAKSVSWVQITMTISFEQVWNSSQVFKISKHTTYFHQKNILYLYFPKKYIPMNFLEKFKKILTSLWKFNFIVNICYSESCSNVLINVK